MASVTIWARARRMRFSSLVPDGLMCTSAARRSAGSGHRTSRSSASSRCSLGVMVELSTPLKLAKSEGWHGPVAATRTNSQTWLRGREQLALRITSACTSLRLAQPTMAVSESSRSTGGRAGIAESLTRPAGGRGTASEELNGRFESSSSTGGFLVTCWAR